MKIGKQKELLTHYKLTFMNNYLNISGSNMLANQGGYYNSAWSADGDTAITTTEQPASETNTLSNVVNLKSECMQCKIKAFVSGVIIGGLLYYAFISKQ